MKFFQPVKPYIVTQPFGANRACVNENKHVITCDGNNPPPGYRSLYGAMGHKGTDLATQHGQEVYCAKDGVVVDIDVNTKSGLDVRVESREEDDIYIHIYEHLLGYLPKKGSKILTGQLIGWADNTGYSSGDHLHWEIWKNGIAINPQIENIFAKDYLYITNKIKYISEQIALISDRIGDYLRQRSINNN